jgi:single-strand DNA-binding protein
MSTLRNKVSLVGHTGKAPEIKEFNNGNKVARITLATNESYKNKQGEKVDNTQWHTVVAFNRLAEIIEKYVSKGQEVMIEGKLVNKSFETKGGEKRYVTEIEATDVLLLGKKSNA